MDPIEAIPDQATRTEPLFHSPEALERFRESYAASVAPKLEQARQTQRESWREAQTRIVS